MFLQMYFEYDQCVVLNTLFLVIEILDISDQNDNDYV
jgi:hypothetical protein